MKKISIYAITFWFLSVAVCQAQPGLLFQELAKLTAADAASEDQFGYCVGVDGDTAVVTSIRGDGVVADSGSAYVFKRNQGGVNQWQQTAELNAPDGQANDNFGSSCTIRGDTIVIGAGFFGSPDRTGAAYIFERNQGGIDSWGFVKRLIGSDSGAEDQFGADPSLSGNTLAVGARLNDEAGINAGAVYIFERNQGGANNWGEVKKLMASDAAPGDELAAGLAISGDTLVVGARFESGTGSVYIFERDHDGPGNWGEVKKLNASDAASGDHFGQDLFIEGDTVVVGSWANDDAGTSSGSAYIFERDHDGPGNWGEVTKLVADDAEAGDAFGHGTAIAGDHVVVGALLANNMGAIYVRGRNHDGLDNWGELGRLTASDAAGGDQFGFRVAMSGDTIAAGAPHNDDAGTSSGSAYIFGILGPELVVPSAVAAASNEPVAVPISFTANGSDVAGIAFSIDYDEGCLSFDPSDSDADGIPESIVFHTPPAFDPTVFPDLGDIDGEIDIVLASIPPQPIPDGDLATITYETTCLPPPGPPIVAPILFSSNPSVSFSDTGGHSIAGTAVGGHVEILPGQRGNCNAEDGIDVADVISDGLEIFDGDGDFWLDVPGGSFAGDPVGCDANADTVVDAGDLSCIARLIFSLSCGNGEEGAQLPEATQPRLTLPDRLRVSQTGSVEVPVGFTSGNHSISSLAFSIDFDQTRLSFDSTDADGDDIPDAVVFSGVDGFLKRVVFNAEDHRGELDILVTDLGGAPLSDGPLATIELLPTQPVSILEDAVHFSRQPRSSFGDGQGSSIPGMALPNGSFLFSDGFESGDSSAWGSTTAP